MTKIGFYANNLTERGTGVATFDYATLNQDVLGNESVVLYDSTFSENDPRVVAKFANSFELIPCEGFGEADDHLTHEGCDLLYALKSGERDEILSKAIPTMVHSVFPVSVSHVHGAAFAFVSEWLSRVCTRDLLPWVPHVVSIGDSDETLRATLGIPENALVFGCYGGKTSFDIDFVKSVAIPHILETDTDIWFVFMNIQKFIEHPRVVFLPGSVDVADKTTFINTCDAMLHGRKRGETFGIAVGEFSLRGKPVISYGKSRERAHLDTLGETALRYNDATQLIKIVTEFDRSALSAKSIYQASFSQDAVSKLFASNLIEPASKSDLDGARRRLGLRRYDPLLLARTRLQKTMWKHLR